MVCIKMPIIRKVTVVGASKGITLPKSWIEWVEKETGQKLTKVLLEIDRTITIIPYIRGKNW